MVTTTSLPRLPEVIFTHTVTDPAASVVDIFIPGRPIVATVEDDIEECNLHP